MFSDPLARIFPGEAHSGSEVREIIIGHSTTKHLPLVCFTEPVVDHIRITSARRAPKTDHAVMKNISKSGVRTNKENGLQAEYRFDYSKSKPNRFATRIQPGAVAVRSIPTWRGCSKAPRP